MNKIQLTEMQKFCLNTVNRSTKKVNPNYIAHLWGEHKNKNADGSSRRTFGNRTAAYKTLRKLAKMGLINQHLGKTNGGYSTEEYSSKINNL